MSLSFKRRARGATPSRVVTSRTRRGAGDARATARLTGHPGGPYVPAGFGVYSGAGPGPDVSYLRRAMAAKAQVIAAQGIGERLVLALRRRGLALEGLADRLGVDVLALRDAVDRDRLRADLAPRLAARLGVEPAWLLYGEEDGESPLVDAPAPAAAPASGSIGAGATPAADADDDEREDDTTLTQADAVARVLRALPDGERGRALKLAVLDALDASAREDNVALPLAVRGLRRRVQELAL